MAIRVTGTVEHRGICLLPQTSNDVTFVHLELDFPSAGIRDGDISILEVLGTLLKL